MAIPLKDDGRVFFASTRVAGRFTIRLAILDQGSHQATMDLAIQVAREQLGRFSRERGSGP